MLPPMILFWYERTPANVINSLPSGWIAGNTERGWMTADSFCNYITTKFHPWLTEHNIEFPVVLYVDGHASHVTLAVSQFCKANQIELIALYPNATHILQPLDVAVFHPIKSKWKKAVDQWRIDHGAQKLKRENFAPVLKLTLDSMPNLATIIKHGFQTCGLSPFSSDAVDFNVLNKKKNKVTECSVHVDQDLKDRNSEQEEAKKHFKYLESRLSRDDIHDFENAFSSGSLKISNSGNEGLFKYWLDLKTLAAENVSNNVSLSDNSGLDESEALIEIVDSMPCIPIELDIDLDVSNMEVVLMPEENDENSSTLITETHINTSMICEPQGTFVEPIEADLQDPFEDCDPCDSFKGDKVAEIDKHNDKVCEGLKDNLEFSNQILNISAVEGSTESQNNGNERNQTDSEVLDLSVKKVANLFKQSDETIVQDTVLTEIHNCMINNTQNIDAECRKDERRENISSPFKTALIWPAQILKQKKKKPIKMVSTLLTSEEWQQHYLRIQQEKLRKQKEVEDRKKHREEVKKRKAEEKEAKMAVAKEKKKLEEEIKRLITKKKTLQK